MGPPFHRLTLEEFADVLARFPFTRRINAVHLHHTRRPTHDQYRGHDSLVELWRYQTQTNGLRTIAYHLAIAPDGTIWTGRNWNQPPASAAGHNGNRSAGPFMLALIGDFEDGYDQFADEQRRAALDVIMLIQKRFSLLPQTLYFHSQMSEYACPGAAIDYQQLLADLNQRHATAESFHPASNISPEDGGPFPDKALLTHAVVTALSKDDGQDDAADAEPHEDAADDRLHALGHAPHAARSTAVGKNGTQNGQRTASLSPDVLNALRPHVVNLHLGQFSTDGSFTTTPGDVDAIFEDYLVRALAGAKARNEPLRLLFYAHGGLVKESAGLGVAAQHVGWWMSNHVYPIFFVWETGLFETIGQLLQRSRQAVRGATRDVFDYTTDPLIEATVRELYAPRIWSGMQRSAEQAVAHDGGARYVAQKLKSFCDTHGKDVQIELHAAGHSAGSIFHAHFLPTALDLGVPSFRTTHFLAPAIRVDAFQERLAGRLGNGLDQLTVFTMNTIRERSDNCAQLYRKSLLYLIYHALEAEPKTPILGLETCLRNDRALSTLFGLGTTPSATGEVVWSDTPHAVGRSASAAIHHGDFDTDPPTMNSVARRVLGVDDSASIKEYPAAASGERSFSSWDDQVDWPQELDVVLGTEEQPALPVMPPMTPPVTPPFISVPVAPAAAPRPPVSGSGRRRALCIGINQYPTAPLYGCVADAQLWQTTLRSLGFDDVTTLLDREATRDAILASLTHIITTSVAGDTVAFQFAGHGTQLPDAGSDEADGDSPAHDEAICPINYDEGAFVIDDDIGAIFEQIPEGVNVTCFIDCCHSGTISRFGVGAPGAAASAKRDGPIPRFVVATPQMITNHRRFRQGMGARLAPKKRGLSMMREILFAACLSSEVAYEKDGHGDFTLRATALLRAEAGTLTNAQFEERMIAAFGTQAMQHPRLYCHPNAKAGTLLQPFTNKRADTSGNNGTHGGSATAGNGHAATTAQLLRLVASLVEHA